ncbi:hypothetical protein EES42_06820 [Streptomyces sp. ADI95-17]|nr:hypothetical protein EES42_06820 [Streptomyces sp. ADI95-17]
MRVAELDVHRALRQHLEAEVLVEPGGAGEDAGVHAAVRVPDVLEAGEEGEEFVPVHAREQFGAGLAVAVFAAQ